MLQHLSKFTLLLFFFTGASYIAHIFLNREFFNAPVALINFSYKFNVGITLIFTTSIILASDRLKEQIGFIYMAGGFVKLAVFFYLIKNLELTIGRSVFLHVFFPYVVCVLLELFYVIKLLNQANFKNDN